MSVSQILECERRQMSMGDNDAVFAHLHSSPLVVRRQGAAPKDLALLRNPSSGSIPSVPRRTSSMSSSSSGSSEVDDTFLGARSGLEPVEIIDVKEERRLLIQCLREAHRRVVWRTEVADLHTFRKVLSYGCRALHFSGHGVPGRVIFENAKGEAQFLCQDELRELLLAGGRTRKTKDTGNVTCSGSFMQQLNALMAKKCQAFSQDSLVEAESLARETERISLQDPTRIKNTEPPMRLVFVSACHSESVASAFVAVGVPHVVVVSRNDKVLDKTAMEFSKAFYTALFAGHEVDRAFEIGQVQADLAAGAFNSSDSSHHHHTKSGRFKLLGNGDHSERLFKDLTPGEFITQSPSLPTNECDAVAEVFVGRSLEVHSAYKSLVEGARLVSITGEFGIGKTEVALQCAQYATERRIFQHIFFLTFDSRCDTDSTNFVARFAKALHVPASGDCYDDFADAVRFKYAEDGKFLLVLDGCNRVIRQNNAFRRIIRLLLRRVSSLAILVTGDGKIGGMDGVGEKIVAIDRMPPLDAALLFTLRAPRKIKAHEMGDSPDLAAFGEHPVIKKVDGHPRAICAVSQFLDHKDMELDQHEFLNYIIPSVNVGLRSCSSSSIDTLSDTNSKESMNTSMSTPTSHSDLLPHGSSSGSWKSSASSADILVDRHPLRKSLSERSSRSDSELRSHISSTPQASVVQMCITKVAEDAIQTVESWEASGMWAFAVIESFGKDQLESSNECITRLLQIERVPMQYLAVQLCRYFAIQLKGDAVKRPLSLRSIEFLVQSACIWGVTSPPSTAPKKHVTKRMFACFWKWFEPLTEAIVASGLWGYTQPRLLHGFLSKSATINMLQKAPPGTFLLRCSETRQRCIVIAYVHDDGNVQFVPVTYQKEEGRWFVELQKQRRGVTFATITELILSVSVLKVLFPYTPKETAFPSFLN